MKQPSYPHIRKESFTKDRTKMFLALLTLIVLTIGSMHVSKRVALTRLKEAALTESRMQASSLRNVVKVLFDSHEWVVNSFLSNFVDITADKDKDGLFFRHTIKDRMLKELSADKLGRSLQSFRKYNSEHLSEIFILEPGVVDWAPDGVAISTRDSLDGWKNLLKDYDLLNHSFYRSVADGNRPKSRSSIIRSSDKRVCTYAVPIFGEDGKFIGEFWSDTKVSMISDLLKSHTSENDLFVCIISRDGTIMSCSERSFNGFTMKDMLAEFFKEKISEDWYKGILGELVSGGSGVLDMSFEQGGTISYYTPIQNTEFHLVIAKSADKIFEKTEEFLREQALVNLVTTLVIAILIIPIFLKYKKENDTNRRLKGELAVAASIQASILPPNPGEGGTKAIPGVNVYGFQKQAKSVGGDLYDYAVNGNKLHFCIGDVSGKGIPAALLMTQVCSLYRNISAILEDPSELIQSLNKADIGGEKDKMFCTMFAGVLDLETGHVEYCNAGHNPPMVYRKDSGLVTFLQTDPNLPVFAFDDYSFSKGELELEKGDKLILYTDGVTEAGYDNQFFGKDAALEAVSKKAKTDNKTMVRYLLDRIHEFTGGAPQSDDITILCMEYKAYDNKN